MNYCIFLWATLLSAATAYVYNPYAHYNRYTPPYHPFSNHVPYNAYLPAPSYQPSLYQSQTPSPYEHGHHPIGHPEVAPPIQTYTTAPATLTILAEEPYSIRNTFTSVPLLVMAKESIATVQDALILNFSKEKPLVTVKTKSDELMQCTPAVKLILDEPLPIYSLRTTIPFPDVIEVVHDGFKIPIAIGAVIAPISQNVFVSPDAPVPVSFLYAIPTRPLAVDYVNNDKDVVIKPDIQAVIVDSDGAQVGEHLPPPKNVSVVDFPDRESEPTFQVDEEDEELVNRNPPSGILPAGIVQSTQPIINVQPFQNSKESPLLTIFREETLKHRTTN